MLDAIASTLSIAPVLAAGVAIEWKDIVEIGIIFIVLMGVFYFLRGTGGAGVLKGLFILFTVLILGLFTLANAFELYRIDFLLKNFLGYLFFTILIVFQPELRRGLIRLSQNTLFSRFFGSETERSVNTVAAAVSHLSREKIGALVALEKGVPLTPFVESGTVLDARISVELLNTIFHYGSALHDGGVIVSNDRIVAAGCVFPLSDNPNLSRRIGTRHRAAIGLTEESDSLCVVVSEETGLVSVARHGELTRGVDRDSLVRIMETFYREAAELKAQKTRGGDV